MVLPTPDRTQRPCSSCTGRGPAPGAGTGCAPRSPPTAGRRAWPTSPAPGERPPESGRTRARCCGARRGARVRWSWSRTPMPGPRGGGRDRPRRPSGRLPAGGRAGETVPGCHPAAVAPEPRGFRPVPDDPVATFCGDVPRRAAEAASRRWGRGARSRSSGPWPVRAGARSRPRMSCASGTARRALQEGTWPFAPPGRSGCPVTTRCSCPCPGSAPRSSRGSPARRAPERGIATPPPGEGFHRGTLSGRPGDGPRRPRGVDRRGRKA